MIIRYKQVYLHYYCIKFKNKKRLLKHFDNKRLLNIMNFQKRFLNNGVEAYQKNTTVQPLMYLQVDNLRQLLQYTVKFIFFKFYTNNLYKLNKVRLVMKNYAKINNILSSKMRKIGVPYLSLKRYNFIHPKIRHYLTYKVLADKIYKATFCLHSFTNAHKIKNKNTNQIFTTLYSLKHSLLINPINTRVSSNFKNLPWYRKNIFFSSKLSNLISWSLIFNNMIRLFISPKNFQISSIQRKKKKKIIRTRIITYFLQNRVKQISILSKLFSKTLRFSKNNIRFLIKMFYEFMLFLSNDKKSLLLIVFTAFNNKLLNTF